MTSFNVKDYGAKGDRWTDDSTAIQAAINAALAAPGKASVDFPPGTYTVGSRDLDLPVDVDIEGEA